MIKKSLVYLDEYGLLGTNYYWRKCEDYGLSKKELISVGLTNDRVRIHKDIINLLISINSDLLKKGFRLYIKEGYRSKKLYKLIYKKRVQKNGKENTDRLFNMKDMSHSTGKSVDLALWDLKNDQEIYLRAPEDGFEALFYGFYKNHPDKKGKHFHKLQNYVIGLMKNYEFQLGKKHEYFHFDYRPSKNTSTLTGN